MRNSVAVVLGGGRGTRLRPLTAYRSKPAVPLAAKYRLIDIPLSNCINSEINKIFVLTQFMSVSLHRHIRSTYRFDVFSQGFVEILAAQQTPGPAPDWYEGTADAVRKNIRYLTQPGIEYIFILSGDQLYRMDFREMLRIHQESGADVTIAAKPVDRQSARSLGVMRVDDTGQVRGFREKPSSDNEIDDVAMDPAWIDAQGLASNGRDCLASMGIYLYSRKALLDVMEKTDYRDFGKDVFPASIRSRHVQVFLFDGYWEDIGTIGSFYDANLRLTQPDAPFPLASIESPIYSRPRFLPPTRVDGATIAGSLIADGCFIEPGANIVNSVIGLRCRIGRDVEVRDSIIMGADYYEAADDPRRDASLPPLGIGAGSIVSRAIVDKNCRIGKGAHVACAGDVSEHEFSDRCAIHDGILVVGKESHLPDGWRPHFD